MDEKNILIPHSVSIDDRKRISITGVTDVGSFHEEQLELFTSYGELIIRGENLQVISLSLEKGELCAEGVISSFSYTENIKKNKSIFARLLS